MVAYIAKVKVETFQASSGSEQNHQKPPKRYMHNVEVGRIHVRVMSISGPVPKPSKHACWFHCTIPP